MCRVARLAALAAFAFAGAALAAVRPGQTPPGKMPGSEPGALVLRKLALEQADGSKQTIDYPYVAYRRRGSDGMNMYLCLDVAGSPGRVHWVHFSKIKLARFKQTDVEPATPRRRGDPAGPERQAAQPGVLPWGVKVATLVTLDDGTTLKGWLQGELNVSGLNADGVGLTYMVGDKPTPMPPAGSPRAVRGPASAARHARSSPIVSLALTQFALVPCSPRRRGNANSVERPDYGDGAVTDWRKAALGNQPRLWAEKAIDRAEAARLYDAHRSETQRWTMTDGGRTTTVDAAGIYHRWRTSSTGSTLYIGASWSVAAFYPLDEVPCNRVSGKASRVEFTDKAQHVMHEFIVELDGRAITQSINVFPGGPDYVFTWKTDYGFEGASVAPARKAVFARADHAAGK